ncbi:hypothetical protein Acy02nite_90060 [Actinoplanes cyaneus]|uniref:Transposase n=1 Tax=Actinoplanes cyaneus TaxID=52696 RepID=A0A919IZT1_9ACTN|nr:zinc-finger of transposase IS204/IS1001/IS1096/IS1165 [Actinoplanes cyaneus]GID71125.1 hypothetical protein Acy02nite_90060 [Actinoplanes cyaneus]
MLSTVFAGLSPLVIEDVVDQGELILIQARTPSSAVACPGCRALTQRVHGYHERVVADVPVDARRVVLRVRVRRLVCPTRSCRQTFREQIPGVLERYQRRTPRLADQIGAVVKELAGRAGVRLLSALAVLLSRHTALRVLLGLPPPDRPVPRILGVDDFALRRSRQYATVLIDAETHDRVDVLLDRRADTLESWLREHPGVQIVCRDSSATYAEAVRRALPDAVQVADRWHLWHNLAEATGKEVAAHSLCWAKAGPPPSDSDGLCWPHLGGPIWLQGLEVRTGLTACFGPSVGSQDLSIRVAERDQVLGWRRSLLIGFSAKPCEDEMSDRGCGLLCRLTVFERWGVVTGAGSDSRVIGELREKIEQDQKQLASLSSKSSAYRQLRRQIIRSSARLRALDQDVKLRAYQVRMMRMISVVLGGVLVVAWWGSWKLLIGVGVAALGAGIADRLPDHVYRTGFGFHRRAE